MIYKNEKWVLDTEEITVKNLESGESRHFFTDHVRYHLHYSEEYVPERLQKLVDEGKILEYLEDFEMKVTDALNDQTEEYMKSDKEYKIALESGNLVEVGRIGNMLTEQAKESIYASMVYV